MIAYPRFAHPEHPELFCQPILVSKPTNGAKPIMTIHGHYPRPIHGEIMTHRKFGRNARSSRAVPVRKMLEEVRTKPYVPWHWGANQKGMQAGAECNEIVWAEKALMPLDGYAYGHSSDWAGTTTEKTGITREDAWLIAAERAAQMAEAYMNAGYHKQNPNRLLEPFAWIDTLITSTSWANFRHLRDHKDAEPHFQDFTRLVVQAIEWIRKEGAFQTLEPGQWHLPYIIAQDVATAVDHLRNGVKIMPTDERIQEVLKKVSAARCARISYEPFDGNPSFERELERFDFLVSSDRIHASPLEHQATPDTLGHYERLFIDENDKEELLESGLNWDHPELAGNLGPGWVQFRKTIPGEYIEDENWL